LKASAVLFEAGGMLGLLSMADPEDAGGWGFVDETSDVHPGQAARPARRCGCP
jgi:hypothetical protein